MSILGIDVGGSAIKGALIDPETGQFLSERYRIATDEICTPDQMGSIVKDIMDHFEYSNVIGIGFPAPIKNNIAKMAANIHQDWIGKNVVNVFQSATNCESHVINDADAAGLAEIRFGAGRDRLKGVILMVTLGTGIGSAVFVNGELLPNCEFGHLQIRGKDAERRASDAVRKQKNLSWKAWASRLQEYFDWMEKLISPDLIIVGGGVSKKSDKFLPYLELECEIKPAVLLNEAGIIGAACYAGDQLP